ncbi:cupin-like domain-containing protein [Caulobacter sp.]|uniref:cupin-like domain-containing protein n=1 Tax=Caulobacter sp. TaxID=78 RepID=UPI003BAA30BF
MPPSPAPVRTREWRDVTRDTFRDEIMPANQPAILKGLVAHWPATRAGQTSDEAMAGYLMGLDAGKPITILNGGPEIGGRFFYTDDMGGLNFRRRSVPLGEALKALLSFRQSPEPPALAVQSTPTAAALPGFSEANGQPLLDAEVGPRIWIGNAITTATHFDMNYNIACAVAGRRRFTLFPPDQLKNLYLGPLEFTPAGPPVSLVDVAQPDLDRFPRFAEAWRQAQVAELEPGDAIYIPYFWFHNVESLDPFTVLVNYWWTEPRATLGRPLEALLHALASIRELSPSEREIWRGVFDHFVFKTHGDPVAHIPPDRRGSLGEMTPEHIARIRAILISTLSQA